MLAKGNRPSGARACKHGGLSASIGGSAANLAGAPHPEGRDRNIPSWHGRSEDEVENFPAS
jgi:hypothetical protein